jgi:hypothetical protein
MRVTIPFVLTMAFCVLSPANADRSLPFSPIVEQSQMSDYCLYGGTIYSIGSTVCIKKQGLVCVPVTSTEDGKVRSCEQGKNCPEGVGGRAYWSTRTVASPWGGKEEQPIIWSPPSANECQ